MGESAYNETGFSKLGFDPIYILGHEVGVGSLEEPVKFARFSG